VVLEAVRDRNQEAPSPTAHQVQQGKGLLAAIHLLGAPPHFPLGAVAVRGRWEPMEQGLGAARVEMASRQASQAHLLHAAAAAVALGSQALSSLTEAGAVVAVVRQRRLATVAAATVVLVV
jgi:hypothetical protein